MFKSNNAKKTTVLLIILSMLLNIYISDMVFAVNGNIINDITLNQNEFTGAGTVKISVDFGGPGIKVYDGQKAYINWNMENAKFNNSSNKPEIHLKDALNKDIGVVTFTEDSAVITFNSYAAGLDNIMGSFSFYQNLERDRQSEDDVPGKITIVADNVTEIITINKVDDNYVRPETDNMFRKQGVADTNNPDLVDWVFIVNDAKKAIASNVSVLIEDVLDDSMYWDIDKINTHSYLVNITDKSDSANWKNKEAIEKSGVKIEVKDQKLTIEVSEGSDLLNEKTLEFRIPSKLTEKAMQDPNIMYVNNKADIKVNNDVWEINDDDKESNVELYKSEGWASGTVQGQLVINKVIEGTKIGIPNVEFEVEKLDGDFKTIIKTDENGKAEIKNLEVGNYKVKEVHAPEWIDFEASLDNKDLEFTVSKDDKEGIELNISNKKKLIDLRVEKIWKDSNESNYEVDIALLRDGDIIESTTLTGKEQVHIWEGLEISDDYGNFYDYSVKEVGEEDGYIVIDNNKYKVAYDKNNNSFTVINEFVEPGEEKPTEPGEEKPTEPGEEKPTEPGEEKPTEPGEEKPTEPGEEKPTEPGEEKPTEPGEEKPTEPSEEKPTKPGEEKPKYPYNPPEERPGNPDKEKPSKPITEEAPETPTEEENILNGNEEEQGKDKEDGSKINNGNKKDKEENKTVNKPENKNPESSDSNSTVNKGKELPKTGDGLNSKQIGILLFIFGSSLILIGFKLSKDEKQKK